MNIAQQVKTLLQFLDTTGIERTLPASISIDTATITKVLLGPRRPGLESNPTVALRRFFDFAILEGRLGGNPMPVLKGLISGPKVKLVPADIEAVLDKWEGWLYAEFRLANARLSSDKAIIRRLVTVLKIRNLSQLLKLSSDPIGEYVDQLSGRKSIKQQALLTVKRLFDFAIAEGLVASNPADEMHVSGSTERTRSVEILTVQEVARAFAVLERREVPDWIKARDLCFASLLYRPRLRASEAVRLTRADVGDRLRVRSSRGSERLVDLDERSSQLLARYLAVLPFALRDDELIFRSSIGGPFRGDVLQRLASQSKLVLSPSALRRSAAVHFHDELGGRPGIRAQSGERRLSGAVGDEAPDGLFEAYRRMHPRWAHVARSA